MDVVEYVQHFLRAHDSKAEEQVFLQVKRPHKLMFVLLQFGFRHLEHVDVPVIYHLHGLPRLAFDGPEMCEQLRVVHDGRADGLFEVIGGHFQRELNAGRHIVEGGRRVLHALEIDAQLSIGERTAVLTRLTRRTRRTSLTRSQ